MKHGYLVCSCVCAAALAAMPAEAGAAWNPLKSFVQKAEAVGRGIGGVLASPFGGFVDGLAQPTIRDAEDSVHRVVMDVDIALSSNIDRIGGVATLAIGQTNLAVADRLDQVNRSLEARIVQVKAAADDSVALAFERADNLVGRLDDVARKRINQIQNAANQIIYTFDEKLNKALTAEDEILMHRLADVRDIVASALQQADQVAQARIDQLDEIAGKRIGNVDTVASKQALNLEKLLLRLAAMIAVVAFSALVLWWLFKIVGTGYSSQPAHLGIFGKVFRSVLPSLPRVAYQLMVAGVAIGVMYYLAIRLPRDAERRSNEQIARETAAFAQARRALDIREARYHEAQLALLAPEQAVHNHALLDKTELLHTVFTRPAKLQTPGGLADLMHVVSLLEQRLGDQDADLIAVKGFITWQVGGARTDELEAALLCARSLEVHANDRTQEFLLASIAKNYIDIVLDEPDLGTPAELDRLRAARRSPDDDITNASPHRFEEVRTYDTAVRKLRDAAAPAYLAMVTAQATLQSELDKPKRDAAAITAARTDRTNAATNVVAAWKAFDEVLSSPLMAGDTVALAAFTLDDATLAHALYYTNNTAANGLPPPLATVDSRVPATQPGRPQKGAHDRITLARTDAQLDGPLRIKMAPLRIEWARRFAPLLGPRAQQVLAFEESQRFKQFEQRAHEFEVAYVGFLIASRAGTKDNALTQLASTAAVGAAEMGLFIKTNPARTSAAASIIATLSSAGGELPEDARAVVEAASQRRAVRLM